MPPDGAHPRLVPGRLAVASVFGMGDRDDVVDKEGGAHVPTVVEPVEPAGPVQAEMGGMEIEGVPWQGRERARPGEDSRHGPGLDQPALRPGRPLRSPHLASATGAAPEPVSKAAIGRIVLSRAILDPARLHRRHDGPRLVAGKHPGAHRGRDHTEAGRRPVEDGMGVGEIDAIDAGRARMLQAGDEPGQVEGGRTVADHGRCLASRDGGTGVLPTGRCGPRPGPAAPSTADSCRLRRIPRVSGLAFCRAEKLRAPHPSGRRSVAQPG